MVAPHELAATGSGTTQTLRVEIEGRLSRVLGALIGRPIAEAIATENLGFKAAAEQNDGPSESEAAAQTPREQ